MSILSTQALVVKLGPQQEVHSLSGNTKPMLIACGIGNGPNEGNYGRHCQNLVNENDDGIAQPVFGAVKAHEYTARFVPASLLLLPRLAAHARNLFVIRKKSTEPLAEFWRRIRLKLMKIFLLRILRQGAHSIPGTDIATKL